MVLLLFQSSSRAQGPSLAFPQLAAGRGYTMTVTLVNTGSGDARCTLSTFDQGGNALSVTILDPPASLESPVSGSSFLFTLKAGATAGFHIDRPGAADVKTGWVLLGWSGGSVSGVATFRLVESGILKSAAGVLAANMVEAAALPVDSSDEQQRYAGFAIVNPNSTNVHLTLTLRDELGSATDTLRPTELNPLAPGKQIARFVHELVKGRASYRGSMAITGQPGESFALFALNQDQGLTTAIPVVSQPSRWRLVWGDEFDGADGSAPDSSKWVFDLGGHGWGNNELQTYTDRRENAFIEGGNLVIKANRETLTGSDGVTRNYTSARLKTQGKLTQKYGRFEARMKITHSQGIWPALWLLGDDFERVGWPACGEMDIMENIGREPSIVHGTIHGPGYSGANGVTGSYTLPAGGRFADDFHLFAMEWEPDSIRWFVDDKLYQSRKPEDLPPGSRWVFDHPFFLLLNVAVGGSWPGNPDSTTVFPQTMSVDYIRVYERIP